jgi:hypothetical protein
MNTLDPPGTRYVIRLADGSFYVKTIAKGNILRSNEISEAQQFPTRFFAMREMARLDDAVTFTQAAIQSWAGKAP